MRASIVLVSVLMLSAAVAVAQDRRTTLDIYVVDVEGGSSVLFVTPSGESVLIDSGNGGDGAVRDADRIMAAARAAGITRIDHLITTHFHGDHIGGLSELARRIPIMEFIDHGPNAQPNDAMDAFLNGEYRALYTKTKHTVAKPGDRINVNGVDWRVVSSARQLIKPALRGRPTPNPYCPAQLPASYGRPPYTPQTGLQVTEDDHSLGTAIQFGRFRTMLLGDLTMTHQFELMCPQNRLGTLDLLLAGRHGNVNGEFLVHALRPRAIVTNNGTRKGAPPEAMKIFYSSPGMEDIWQIHFSELSGQEYAVPGIFIANLYDEQPANVPVAPFVNPPQGQPARPAPQHNGTAYWIKIQAQQDGTFTITNTRNNFSKTYRPVSSGAEGDRD